MAITATFETGTNGSTIATSDTGSATAWDAVTITSPGTLTYDNTHAATASTLSAKVVPSTATSGVFTQWTGAYGTQSGTHYGRVYLYFAANPTDTNHPCIVEALNGATLCGGFNVNSTGKLQIVNASVSVTNTSTNSIALNQWIRVEYKYIHNASTGQIEIKYFANADSLTVTETITSSASLNTQASSDRIKFGISGANPTGYGTFWMDNIIAAETGGYPGPVFYTSYTYQWQGM